MATRRGKKDREGELPESSSVITMERPTPGSEDDAAFEEVFIRRNDQTVWEWLNQFNSDHWRHLICYVWRTMPKIDLKAAGRATSIGKVVEPFDSGWLKRNYGSGGYRLDFSFIPTVGKQYRLCSEYIEILDKDYPPDVPWGEWVEYPDNKNWIWGAKKPEQEDPQSKSPVSSAREHTNLLKDAMDLADRMRPSDNSSLIIEVLRESNRELRESRTAPAPPPPDDKFQSLLLEELRESRKEAKELRMEMLRMQTQPAAAAPPRSDLDSTIETAEKFGKAAEVLGYKRGRSGGGGDAAGQPVNQWLELGAKAIEAIGPSINMFTSHFLSSRRPQQQPTQDQTQPQQPANMQQPQPQIVDTTAQQQHAPDRQTLILQFVKANESLIKKAAPIMLDMYTSGEPGQNFRDWFIDRLGFSTWKDFRRVLGPEGMADAISMNSYFEEMQPRPAVIKWFSDVFSEPANEPDEADSEEEASAAPAVNGKSGNPQVIPPGGVLS